MDSLVLIRVAAALDRSLRRAVLVDLREESPHRFRLVFESQGRRQSVIVSLRPEQPWIGRPSGRWEGLRRTPSPFAAAAAKSLRGRILESLEQVGFDRVLKLRFGDGRLLVVELATHGANLILLDARGRIVGSARRSRSAEQRLGPGQSYRPRPLPPGKLVPYRADAEEIDRWLDQARVEGEDLFDALRRRLFGLGRTGATLVLQESRACGKSPGRVLVERLRALLGGGLDPVIQAPEEPRQAAESGRWEAGEFLLLPWKPGRLPEGAQLFGRSDAAGTAGLYYGAAQSSAGIASRIRGLHSILSRERRRLEDARTKVSRDLAAFEDPDRYRKWGEALLAGLTTARRVGDHAMVADPYDIQGRQISVPAAANLSLTAAAEAHFRHYRKARRGLTAARGRAEAIQARGRRLEALAEAQVDARGIQAVRRLEESMRAEGIPVALEPRTRAHRAAVATARPRLEGVRLFTSSDGLTILVGKGGRQNERLTFKLAAPDDFWFHAQGRPGAHVVVRNPERRPRPPEATLREAAAAAAYYSDAREEGAAEVQWTRRKHVKRARGAPPGTVRLKRFESVRVRPAPPFGAHEPG